MITIERTRRVEPVGARKILIEIKTVETFNWKVYFTGAAVLDEMELKSKESGLHGIFNFSSCAPFFLSIVLLSDQGRFASQSDNMLIAFNDILWTVVGYFITLTPWRVCTSVQNRRL